MTAACYGLNCIPPMVWCWSLHPWPQNRTRFREMVFKDVSWNEVIWVGPSKEEIGTRTHVPGTEGRWPSTSQSERPLKKPTLPTPWTWTCHLQNWGGGEINARCWSHLVCGTLWWQPWKIGTLIYRFIELQGQGGEEEKEVNAVVLHWPFSLINSWLNTRQEPSPVIAAKNSAVSKCTRSLPFRHLQPISQLSKGAR